jgi:hypothetical protein
MHRGDATGCVLAEDLAGDEWAHPWGIAVALLSSSDCSARSSLRAEARQSKSPHIGQRGGMVETRMP